MLHNPFADILSRINNAEESGKKECAIDHVSTVAQSVLQIMKDAGYISDVSMTEGKGDKSAVVKLAGRINKCRAIVPRFLVKKDQYELFEKRCLPAVGVGTLVVSTSKGIKNHREVRGKIGGSLLAYVY